jgi:hypothetical protein
MLNKSPEDLIPFDIQDAGNISLLAKLSKVFDFG